MALSGRDALAVAGLREGQFHVAWSTAQQCGPVGPDLGRRLGRSVPGPGAVQPGERRSEPNRGGMRLAVPDGQRAEVEARYSRDGAPLWRYQASS
jgi:hypothetical protein